MACCIWKFCASLLAIGVVSATYYNMVELNDSVMLTCNREQNVSSKWELGKIMLYFNQAIMNEEFRSNTFLFNNYSLLINPVSLFHEGKFICSSGLTHRAEHVINIFGKCFKYEIFFFCPAMYLPLIIN